MEHAEPGDTIEITQGELLGAKFRVIECPQNRRGFYDHCHGTWVKHLGLTKVLYQNDYKIIKQTGLIPVDKIDTDQLLRQRLDDNLRSVFT